MALSACPQTLKHEYFNVLNTMDHYNRSIINSYIEEAKHYQTKSRLQFACMNDVDRQGLCIIDETIIELLEGILNDGRIPFDVAFCRLIVILPYAQHTRFSIEYVAFFFCWLLGSCFPLIRQNIKFNDPERLYGETTILRYLMKTYFANLNDTRCIKFKYTGNTSTHTISLILKQYITATDYGDSSIASIICDYVQYPNQEFIDFINHFMWQFPLYRHLQRCLAECIDFIGYLDDYDTKDMTKGHLLSRLLIGRHFSDHKNDRLMFEAHRMALMKLRTADGISWYFNQNISNSIRCSVDPKQFIELFESAVPNPWQVMRDAIVNHSLSIFFNGNNEGKDAVVSIDDDVWYKQMIGNVHYIFANIIEHFDTKDMELVRKLLQQFKNCRQYFFRFSVECASHNDLMAWLAQYLRTHDYFRAIEPPPSKKRRLNRKGK
eukprot:880122_1